jgi:hypothetical protein
MRPRDIKCAPVENARKSKALDPSEREAQFLQLFARFVAQPGQGEQA